MLTTRSRLAPLVALAILAMALAACGSGGDKKTTSTAATASSTSSGSTAAATKVSLPAGAVAQVDKATITQKEFEDLLASAIAQGKVDNGTAPPKSGSVAENTIKQQVLEFLVRQSVLTQEAEAAGLKVDQAKVDAKLKEIKDQCCQGKEADWTKYLADRKIPLAFITEQARYSLLLDDLYSRITKNVAVTDADIQKQYDSEKATTYTTPASRTVQYILLGKQGYGKRQPADEKKAQDLIDTAKKGGDFAALAKKESQDPSVKAGGEPQLDVPATDDGSLDAAFRKAALGLKIGEVTDTPVYSPAFGYFIIKAVKDTKAGVKPLADVKEEIRTTLLDKKKQEAADAWLKEASARYQLLMAIAPGFTFPEGSQFAPPGLAKAATGNDATTAGSGTDTAGTDTTASTGTDTAATTAATTG